MASDLFHQVEPSLENYWRSIILFGRNVASYKFALAKALTELRSRNSDVITLDDLAVPFAREICEHIRNNPKQTTSSSSRFLQACREFNSGQLSEDKLRDTTVRLGFTNVIDAFHVVNAGPIQKRFFLDERKEGNRIRLTDDFFQLGESPQSINFTGETEARWRLVETAWQLGISPQLIQVHCDNELNRLYAVQEYRRIDITSSRESLNGYQKGRCFYCYREITVIPGTDELADVDHFIPWMLHRQIPRLNGVWNLVLACRECNRGQKGKSARIPFRTLRERLYRRNEYLISSHHPLRETVISQTGDTPDRRASFLNEAWKVAKNLLIHEWEPEIRGPSTF